MIRSKMVDRILALKLKEPVKIYYLDDVGFVTFRELKDLKIGKYKYRYLVCNSLEFTLYRIGLDLMNKYHDVPEIREACIWDDNHIMFPKDPEVDIDNRCAECFKLKDSIVDKNHECHNYVVLDTLYNPDTGKPHYPCVGCKLFEKRKDRE